jgi:FKBP-type peptidyl-prolyl cis-trans isomerase 2
VISGFDKAVTGMKLGEEKKFIIPPVKAYGKPNPKDRNPEVEMRLVMGTPEGRQIQALIIEVPLSILF